MPSAIPISVLFVCLGNHCRSPAAHAVAAHHAAAAGVAHVVFDSAGTTSQHRGEPPHPLAVAEGARRGYRLGHLGRQIHPDDFRRFDLIVAMESSNIHDLRRLGGVLDQRDTPYRDVEPVQSQLLRRWDPFGMPGDEDLDDPWGNGPDAYRRMYDVIERCIPPLLEHLTWLVSERLDRAG
jgi:protein-tyrosine phosphatase